MAGNTVDFINRQWIWKVSALPLRNYFSFFGILLQFGNEGGQKRQQKLYERDFVLVHIRPALIWFFKNVLGALKDLGPEQLLHIHANVANRFAKPAFKNISGIAVLILLPPSG